MSAVSQDATTTACPACGVDLPATPVVAGPDRVLGLPGEFEIYECPACGCGATRPFVPDDELASLYAGDYDNHDAVVGTEQERGVSAALHRLHRRHILKSPPLGSLRGGRGRLLDVGCGNALWTRMLADEGWDVVGIEPDPAICEIARHRVGDVRAGDIKSAPLDGERFDAILFNHTLEHVAFPLDDLQRAHDLLAPGGRLAIAVPHFGNWERRVFGDKWLMLELPRHRTHFTERGLQAVVERAGFTVGDVRFGSAWGLIPFSIVIAIAGDTRPARNPALRLTMAAFSVLVASPLAIYNKLARDGEVIALVATK